MLLITGILMILAGALAAASLIAAKQPNAKQAIDKLVPFQGIIGVISALWGIWALINVIRSMGSFSIGWLLGLVAAITMLVLGFVLGYALISKYTMKTPEAAAKGEELRLKLVKFQVPLGLVSIGLGIWTLISAF